MNKTITKHVSETKTIYCNKCESETHHKLIAEHVIKDEIPVFENRKLVDKLEIGKVSHKIWECQGCSEISYELTKFKKGMIRFDQETGDEIHEEDKTEVSYFPARKKDLLIPEVFKTMPANLYKLYRQIILNFNAGGLLVCTISLKAFLENLCNHFELEGDSLKERIEQFQVKRLLPVNLVEGLQGCRFIAEEATSKLEEARSPEIELSIMFINSSARILFNADYFVEEIKKQITETISERI